MAEINLESNKYLYGIYYSPSELRFRTSEQNREGIIIYTSNLRNIKNVPCTFLGPLEGVFITDEVLDSSNANLLCRKNQMKKFEKKYKGKFIPFGKYFGK
jgi:hypothetical protein